jgi:hypothetical protein
MDANKRVVISALTAVDIIIIIIINYYCQGPFNSYLNEGGAVLRCAVSANQTWTFH